MKSIIKRHWIAFILSIVAGFIILVPQLVLMIKLGSSYEGVYMMNADAEPHYVARMREFYDGQGIGNPYYYEDKNNLPNVYYTVSESILAFPCWLLGISAPTINLVYKFILPAIIFLLAYSFIFRLTKRRLWSLAAGSLVVLGNSLLSAPDILNLLRLRETYTQFAQFGRPVNPEFSSLVFFGYLHFLLSAFYSKKNRWFVFLAVLFGFSFYAYFYSWTFILALNACLLAALIWKKEYRSFSWKLAVSTFAGLLIGSRAVYEIIAVKNSPFASGVAGEYLSNSHAPILSIAGVAVIVLFALHLWKKTKPKWAIPDFLIAGLLLATIVDVNQQVITGIAVQAGHYYWYFNTPIFMLAISYLCAQWLHRLNSSKSRKEFGEHVHFDSRGLRFGASSRYSNYSSAVEYQILCGQSAGGEMNMFAKLLRDFNLEFMVAIVLIVLSILSVSFIQHSSYKNNAPHAASVQDYSKVFGWLNENAQKNSVVMADEEISDLIPAYTSSNVLDDSYGKYYLLEPARRAYGDDQALADLRAGKKLPFRLDYVVWNNAADLDWKIDLIKNLTLQADFGRLKIYEVKLGR